MSIKKYIPELLMKQLRKQKQIIALKRNYKQDMLKYLKYSFSTSPEKTKRHYEADLIFNYHKIEKGLSLPSPRIGFGKDSIYHLLNTLEIYQNRFGWDHTAIVSLNSLYSYYYFNEKNNLTDIELFKRIQILRNTLPLENQVTAGGVDEVTKDVIDKSNINFKDFAYSRYSVRNFAPGDVSLDLIQEAVYIAQKTPSVCNRQSGRVYVYSGDEIKKQVLKFQNGNKGFGEDASKILIVTSELKDFRGVIERNQCFIDGGMYSMSLIYALHSLGVGTCPLNLCITNNTESNLKTTAKISDSEALIMMIAVGNLPEKLSVASSPRRDVGEVMTVY